MGCLPKGLLRAYLDGALDAHQRVGVEGHLARCARCERAALLAATAEGVRSHLDAVTPPAGSDVEGALRRARDALRQGVAGGRQDERSVAMRTRGAWRPALAGGLALLLLLSLLSVGPGRALARQMLSVFRVRRFAVVQVDPELSRLEDVARQIEGTLFVTDGPEMVQAPTRSEVGSIEEASAAAGFAVRLPGALSDDPTLRVHIEGPSELALRLRGDGLRLMLELAGMDPGAIPAELDEAEVRLTTSSAAYLSAATVSVTQVGGLSVTYPGDIEPALLVEAGLRLLGVSPDEAGRLSQSFDWQTTLLVPLPAEAAEFRQVEVAGVEALLVRERDGAGMGMLWMERDGILYIVQVQGPPHFERLVMIAESMF